MLECVTNASKNGWSFLQRKRGDNSGARARQGGERIMYVRKAERECINSIERIMYVRKAERECINSIERIFLVRKAGSECINSI
jgi:hypothetical protein